MVDRQQTLATLLTFGLALAGGSALALLGAPAAWVTGAMIATACAAVAGVRLAMPRPVAAVTMTVLGASLGTGVTPEVIAGLPHWPLSLAALALTVAAIQWASELFLQRVAGWDRETAFYAAVPGVTTYVLALAAVGGGDIRRIAINQSLRVFLLILLAPTLITSIEPPAAPGLGVVASPAGLAATFAAGIAGAILFTRLKVPAGAMIGAMVASAALHGPGVVTGSFPPALQIAAFVGIGGWIGVRFYGTTLRMMVDAAAASIGVFVLGVAIAGLAAWATAALVGMPFSQVALAFAPGGLDVMSALALSLHLDVAFVAAHQLARFFMIALSVPLLARRISRGRPPAA